MYCYQALIVLTCLALTGEPASTGKSFSGAAASKATEKVVGLGPRPVGSDAHRNLESLIEREVRSRGCKPELDTWTAQTPDGPKPMKNIIAKVPGRGDKPTVVSGHYDTKLMPGNKFVGANDGGSSAGFLLELARTLCGTTQAQPVWIVWLDGEEAFREWTEQDSLYGSRHLAERWSADGTIPRIKALINVDMIGDKNLMLVQDHNSSRRVKAVVSAVTQELGYSQYFQQQEGSIGDDHIPFGRLGVPSVDLIDFDYGPMNSYWHTDADTLDKLDAKSFQIVGDIVMRTLERLGGMTL